jgi:hypothetical protein
MRLRVEPFTVGDFLHVYNRGNRKMAIFRDVSDKWRFLKILRYFNNQESYNNILKKLTQDTKFDSKHPFKFEWEKEWKSIEPVKPLVKITTYCLKENHFHLFLKEITQGGISLFMQKLSNSFTQFMNFKYNQVGRVFQGSYRGKKPSDERTLTYMDAYIQVFNVFEDYPGGIENSLKEFDKAFEFATENPFCSLGESFGKRKLGIVDRDILGEMFPNIENYKEFAYDALLVRNIREILKKSTLE